jgi:hypothetical protein
MSEVGPNPSSVRRESGTLMSFIFFVSFTTRDP